MTDLNNSNLQVLKDLNAFGEDLSFLNGSMKILKKKFGDKFIVIKDKKVISAGDTIDEAITDASKRGVDVGKAVVEFVPKKEKGRIL